MGFFSKRNDDSSSDKVDLFEYAKGGSHHQSRWGGKSEAELMREEREAGLRPLDSTFELAAGGSLHGLNRNPDGSPETIGQHMQREREENERHSRWRNR